MIADEPELSFWTKIEVQDISSNIRSIPIFLRQQTVVHVTFCI